MPSVSEAQAHLFAAVDHGWQPPGRHIDVKVAHEFHEADKREGVYEHFARKRQSSDHQNKY